MAVACVFMELANPVVSESPPHAVSAKESDKHAIAAVERSAGYVLVGEE